jgi:hypothetical protein
MKLLLAWGRGNNLILKYDDPILLKHFYIDIRIEGDEKDLSLNLFYSYRRDIIFELFNNYDNVTNDLFLALFKSA